MRHQTFIHSFAAISAAGICEPSGFRAWDAGQAGPSDVRRDQVLAKPYVNFGKLTLPDKLAFAAASLVFSHCPPGDPAATAITLGIPAGSLSTDLRYMESVLGGFPSPAVFSATLPSSAIADVAIFYGIKGPNRVIAGDEASGLTALELACMLLAAKKAPAVLWMCVNAVEQRDAGVPLLGDSAPATCGAFGLLLSEKEPADGFRARLTADFSGPGDGAKPSRDEVYFTDLFGLLREGKNGAVRAASRGIDATLSLVKEE